MSSIFLEIIKAVTCIIQNFLLTLFYLSVSGEFMISEGVVLEPIKFDIHVHLFLNMTKI